MKNVMKVVIVLSIIMCILLTPTFARVSGSRGSGRASTTRLTPVVRAGARASNNSSSSTPALCMSSIAMALFAYLSFVYF
uniref:Uncharacterized protein n=1 Tax=Solanum tuberosum TaxID=4113 RepID=M1CZJ1_SOLTU